MDSLDSDKKHYFAVRALKIDPDSVLSDLSTTVNTSPTIWFSEIIYQSDGSDSLICAVDFDNQVVYPMDITYLTHIDVYLGLNDSSRLSLMSPSLYGGAWSERVSQIKRLGRADTDSVAEFSSAGSSGWTNQAEVYPGDVYAIKMGSHYSKLYVSAWVGSGEGIAFTAAYQDIEDYDHF